MSLKQMEAMERAAGRLAHYVNALDAAGGPAEEILPAARLVLELAEIAESQPAEQREAEEPALAGTR